MDRSYIPIRKFYEKCLPAAKANGYRFVVCVLARSSDIETLYDKLEKQWYDIDDVTAKDFLFMFAGKYHEDDWRSDILNSVQRGNNHFALRNEYMRIMNPNPHLTVDVSYDFRTREERAKFTPDLPQEHGRCIEELRKYFGLSRRDVPCLVFTNLYTYSNTHLALKGDNLYGILNNLLCELEKIFAVIDELKANIQQYETLRQSKAFNDYVKMNNLRSGLHRVADTLLPEYRLALIDCMENLIFGDGIVDELFCKRLNTYVALSKSFANTDTQTLDYIIEKNEPQHSQDNLIRIYQRADDIISKGE